MITDRSNASKTTIAELKLSDKLNGYEMVLEDPRNIQHFLDANEPFSVLAKKNVISFSGKVVHKGQEKFSKIGKGTLEVNMNYNFFMGGDDNKKNCIPSRIFVTDENDRLPNLPIALSCVTVNFHDHYLYMMGGFDGKRVRNECYRYDFINETWTKMCSMKS